MTFQVNPLIVKNPVTFINVKPVESRIRQLEVWNQDKGRTYLVDDWRAS